MASQHPRLGRSLWAAAVAVLGAAGAHAADPDLRANLGTRLAHTDNIALAAKGSEQSESITELIAGIEFGRSTSRFNAHVAYQAQGVFYADADESNEVFNTLNASSNIALVMDRVFLDVFAVYDQTVVDATEKYSFNKLALTGNRTDAAIIGASPSIALEVGERVRGEIRYSDSRVDYDDPELEDNRERFAAFFLGNSEIVQSGGTWDVRYDNERFEYDAPPPIEYQTLDLELGFWVGQSIRLFTRQGLESDYESVVSGGAATGEPPGLDDHYWYAGLDWQRNDRNVLVVSAGERSFGEAYTFSWHFRTPRGGISMDYSEEPGTFLREQLNSVRRTGELSPIDSLDGPNGSGFYLQKRSGVTFVLERSRSSAGLRFFSDRRFDIVEATNDVEEETEEYSGGEVSLRWEMSAVSTLDLVAQVANRRSTRNVTNDQLRSMSLSYGRQVGRMGHMSITLVNERSHPEAESLENPYVENQISVAIRRGFGAASTSGIAPRFTGYLDASQAR